MELELILLWASLVIYVAAGTAAIFGVVLRNNPERTVLGLLTGCSGRGTKHDAASTAPAVEVAVEVVGPSALGAGLVLPARVKADEEATLTARMAGRVTALPVLEGARVRAGEVLAVFDAPEAPQALGAATSRWRRPRSRSP